ncbi:hypothetical protein K493DRAFT_299819 [Basidiobolus meristosporus CBS 931.73]|uniref:Uncharacterized protein n=1 Tax=Basidiobolus meristosporus CBS 931.73 TaxID=1314790 RepID=A0A1Y1YKW7_9FUNG|nr:hypothetical protein K493DRAFT_299819 [Basidiobolus meristosporus CBS 931.73]|eukprot:ORX98660.1 hypothetical protein K493DRAFT_299819 [Basidiobolus meristosporus CBS 931.73]
MSNILRQFKTLPSLKSCNSPTVSPRVHSETRSSPVISLALPSVETPVTKHAEMESIDILKHPSPWVALETKVAVLENGNSLLLDKYSIMLEQHNLLQEKLDTTMKLFNKSLAANFNPYLAVASHVEEESCSPKVVELSATLHKHKVQSSSRDESQQTYA